MGMSRYFCDMPIRILILTFLILLGWIPAQAAWLHGTVKDEKGITIPGVWVGIENKNQRAITDVNGQFEFKLPNGKYLIQFRCIGYLPKSQEIVVSNADLTLDFVLTEEANELSSLLISSDRSDFAKYLMDKAQERYLNNANPDSILVLDGYQKSSVQGQPVVPKGEDEQMDSTKVEAETELGIDVDTSKWEKWWRKRFPRLYNRKDSINNAKINSAAYKFLKDSIPEFKQQHLMENFAEHQFPLDADHFEKVLAEENYKPYRPYYQGGNINLGVNLQYGENTIYNDRDVWSDPHVYESHTALEEFDILKHHLRIEVVSQKLIVSPFSDLGHATYEYNISSYEEKKGGNVYCIQIQPRFKREALIQGSIWIQDSTFRIEKIEYNFTPRALTFYEDFTFTQEFADWKNIQFPQKRIIDYQIKEGQDSIHGKTVMLFAAPKYMAKNQWKKSKEMQTYADDYDTKEQAYWKEIRPIPLDSLENQYAHFCDSVQTKYNSTRYMTIRDSLYNKVTFWDVTLSGMGFQNSFKKVKYFINPLLANYDFLGVGGIRPKLNGSFSKEFESGKTLFLAPNLSYGFQNKDVRGSMTVGIGYNPNKFMRTDITVQDDYAALNRTPSFGTMLARSNYIRSRGLSIDHTMQIVPALFGRFSLRYNEESSLDGLQLEGWTDALYGDYNQPVAFNSYARLDFKMRFEYRIGQKFYSKKGRIYYLPNKNPYVVFEYYQGIPGIYNTTIDYKKIMLRLEQNFSIPVIGDGFWNLETGQFLRKKNINVGEYYYFRGSDQFIFSNPNNSLQLLGLQLSSSSSYIRGSYLHHFNGLLTNKVPLINRLKITETAGTAMLAIPEKGIWHQELYIGAERVVRIKRQMFRFSVYACTADNSFSKATVQYKFGIAYFNTYNKRWNF
jgi:hypothetical protein